MGIGTFGSFTQARLAIYAAQAAITVTGNNVANVNTVGYTRQKLEQSSLYIGGTDRYYSASNLHIGAGVLCTGVSQIRDPYLDIRYRDQNAAVGANDGWLAGLEHIQQIIDEVGDGEITEGEDFGIISAYLEKIGEALDGLEDWTGQQNYDIQVRSAAESLTHTLNSYASQLNQLLDRTASELDEYVATVNTLLTDIRNLSENIRTADIYGDNALELRDARNNKLDELSHYMKISVTYTTENVGAGKEIEKMVLKLGNANPDAMVETDETTLIDGIYGGQISILPKLNPEYVDDTTTPGVGKYIDREGNATDDLSLAAHNDNFNMQVSELLNSRGQRLYYLETTSSKTYTAADIAGMKDSTGTKDIVDSTTGKLLVSSDTQINTPAPGSTTITVYSSTYSYQSNPNYATDGFRYLKADGTGGTNNKAEAARIYTYHEQTYVQSPSRAVSLDDNDLSGKLQAYRELLTEAGEFTPKSIITGKDENGNDLSGDQLLNCDENAGTKRGIPYYMKVLDLFANQLATVMNNANQGYLTDPEGNLITKDFNDKGAEIGVPLEIAGVTMNTSMLKGGIEWDLDKVPQAVQQEVIDAGYVMKDADGKPLEDKNGDPIADINSYLQNEPRKVTLDDGTEVEVPMAFYRGGPLFSNHGDSDATTDPQITAANISVSASWSSGPLIVNSFTCPPGLLEPATTDSSNILEGLIGPLRYQKMEFYPDTLESEKANGASHDLMFTGTFTDMWVNTGTVLGEDMTITGTSLDTHYETALQIDSSRDSVSGVDFNEEATNLMMFAKAYNAACRVMTTLDSVLDKLINGTGVT